MIIEGDSTKLEQYAVGFDLASFEQSRDKYKLNVRQLNTKIICPANSPAEKYAKASLINVSNVDSGDDVLEEDPITADPDPSNQVTDPSDEENGGGTDNSGNSNTGGGTDNGGNSNTGGGADNDGNTNVGGNTDIPVPRLIKSSISLGAGNTSSIVILNLNYSRSSSCSLN